MKKFLWLSLLVLLLLPVACEKKEGATIEPMNLSEEGELVALLYGEEEDFGKYFFTLHFPPNSQGYEVILYQVDKGEVSKGGNYPMANLGSNIIMGLLVQREEIRMVFSNEGKISGLTIPLPNSDIFQNSTLVGSPLLEKRELKGEHIFYILEGTDEKSITSPQSDLWQERDFGKNDGFFLTISPMEGKNDKE